MKLFKSKSWGQAINLLKITAVVLLFIVIAFDQSLRISSYTTFWITGACIFVFILGTVYGFFTKGTPSIQAMRWLRKEQNNILLRIPITHYSVFLRIMGNDLLFIFFAANLIYLSLRIPMVKWGGIILGILLMAFHVYSLLITILNRKLVGIFITDKAIMYYEYKLEHIPWEQIVQIKVEGLQIYIEMENSDQHMLDFEDEEKDFNIFEEMLEQQCQQRRIPLNLISDEAKQH